MCIYQLHVSTYTQSQSSHGVRSIVGKELARKALHCTCARDNLKLSGALNNIDCLRFLSQAKEEIGAQMEIEAKKDAIDEKTVLDVISGDLSAPHPVISELQCHTQLVAPKVGTYSVLNSPNQL